MFNKKKIKKIKKADKSSLVPNAVIPVGATERRRPPSCPGVPGDTHGSPLRNPDVKARCVVAESYSRAMKKTEEKKKQHPKPVGDTEHIRTQR